MSSNVCPDCHAVMDSDNESHAGFYPLCGSSPSDSNYEDLEGDEDYFIESEDEI